MVFIMKYTAHPDRRTAFERAVEKLGLRHWTIEPRSPWQNAFIERSHRTDNEELFDRVRFGSPEERCYYHRLWEGYYNNARPHQGLGGRTPLRVFRQDYQLHAASRMLM